MRGCFPKNDWKKGKVVVVGIENGLIPGRELSAIFPEKFSESHWYDLGISAVTVIDQGSPFTYVSYARPLQIPNHEDQGMISPDHHDGVMANLKKYSANILPLLEQKKDLYAVFSDNQMSREETLFDACCEAMQRLLNVHALRDSQPFQPVDSVVTFGCFDLFHPLHQRLIDHAYSVGRQVIVYVYNKEYKSKGDQRVALTDTVQQRITNVIQYATEQDKTITARRMQGKHLVALKKAIKMWSSKGGTVAVFGGDDQFADYPELLDLCYKRKIPIVAINRGDTKEKLCSSDLREKQSYQRLAAIYNTDLSPISPLFWKKRIHNSNQAKEHLKQQAFLGAGRVDIVKFNPVWPIDLRITKPCITNDKIMICLPGRTPSNWGRVRKILQTLAQLIPESLGSTIERYLLCYEEDGRTTKDYLDALEQDPEGYFSDDAMEITRCLIMPRVSPAIRIQIEENGWCIHIPDNFEKKTWSEIVHDLAKVTLWGRSRGSVIAIEIENAFRYCMVALGYKEDEIRFAAQCIGVVSVSNLASLDRDRLFTTVSVTGINDQVARTYIPGFSEPSKLNGGESAIEITIPSANHCAVVANIPNQLITDEGVTIHDEKCHYTPLDMSLRQAGDCNDLPLLVRDAIGKMLFRDTAFDLTTIARPSSESLSALKFG